MAALMEDMNIEEVQEYSLLYKDDIVDPGMTLNPWESTELFVLKKVEGRPTTRCLQDMVPEIIFSSGFNPTSSQHSSASRTSALDARSSSKSILTAADPATDIIDTQSLKSLTTAPEPTDYQGNRNHGWNFKSIFQKYGKTVTQDSDSEHADSVVWKGIVKSKKKSESKTEADLPMPTHQVVDSESIVWTGAVKSKAFTQPTDALDAVDNLDDLDAVVWKGAVKSKRKGSDQWTTMRTRLLHPERDYYQKEMPSWR
ncbi:hypothetical protein BC830DRAFT_1087521, partial [Chytriomyces sp. MP71]